MESNYIRIRIVKRQINEKECYFIMGQITQGICINRANKKH